MCNCKLKLIIEIINDVTFFNFENLKDALNRI